MSGEAGIDSCYGEGDRFAGGGPGDSADVTCETQIDIP